MAKTVGMSRNIKIQWLNKVVSLVLEDLSENEIKEALNEYLKFEISSPTNLRKTREILMNIWVYENEDAKDIKNYSLNLIKETSECPLIIHWSMILITYPVFADMCKLIGKFSEFQEVITLSQLKQKLFDEWGERTTLHHSIDKLVASLKDFGALNTIKPGKYSLNIEQVKSSKYLTLMLSTLMLLENKSYYSLNELNSSHYFFPFSYSITKEFIYESSKFNFSNFGGELYVIATDKS